MLIIIEGPDGSGKSTLADKLRDELQGYILLVRTNSKPRGGPDILHVARWLKEPSIPVIVDRHPLTSELVYSHVLNRKPKHDLSHADIARRFADSLLIYCRPPLSVILQGVESLPQMEGVKDNLEQLVQTYDLHMGRYADLGVQALEYNYEDPRMRITERVQDFINKGIV